MEDHFFTPEKLVAILLFGLVLVILGYLVIVKGKEVWKGILGEDKILQAAEMAVVLFLLLLPVLIICDVVLGLKASDQIWITMDVICGSGVFGSAIKKAGRNNNNKKHIENENVG